MTTGSDKYGIKDFPSKESDKCIICDDCNECPLPSCIEDIKHPKKRLFLEKYPLFLTNVKTAEAIGVSEWTIDKWQQSDETFVTVFTSLKKKIDERRLQAYEAELDKRVLVNPSKQSDILLMFGLKAFNPNKYREKSETKFSGEIVVRSAIPRPESWVQIQVEKPKQIPEKTEPSVTEPT